MKRSGEIITFNAAVTPALNVFGQVAVPTGLYAGGNEALLMLGAQYEFNVALEANATREAALVRASKTAMPNLLDDDLIIKNTLRSLLITSGLATQDLTPFAVLPPNAIVLVESNFYLAFKTTGQTTLMNASALVYFERVTLTDAEKNSILSSRLNNLLN